MFPHQGWHFIFWAEMLASSGRYRDVYRRLLNAMHSTQPWLGFGFIARKAFLASRDAEAQRNPSVNWTSPQQDTIWKSDSRPESTFLTAHQWELIQAEAEDSPQPEPAN